MVTTTSAIRDIVHSDPETMGGTPVFVGTRVPVDALFDYLGSAEGLNGFLDDFPSVTREQAIAAIEIGHAAVVEAAHARAPR